LAEGTRLHFDKCIVSYAGVARGWREDRLRISVEIGAAFV
jgi:hypothetical protein